MSAAQESEKPEMVPSPPKEGAVEPSESPEEHDVSFDHLLDPGFEVEIKEQDQWLPFANG